MYKIINKQKFNFSTGKLDNDVLIHCPITGMISTLRTCGIYGIVLDHKHPAASAENAIKLLTAAKNNKSQDKIEVQLMAGCVLSLLSAKGKTTGYPNSSATEANMLLQSAGTDILWQFADVIMARWDSDATWIRVPKLSFDLVAYSQAQQSMAMVISRHTRIIRKALSLDELPAADTAEVYKAFKENSIKNNKNKNDPVLIENAINRSINQIKDDSLLKQKDTAKRLITFFKDKLPRNITLQAEKIMANLWAISSTKRIELAMTIRLAASNMKETDKANNLAWIIENAIDHNTDDDILGAMDTEIPATKSRKTLAEIFAEKGIKQ